MPSNIGRGLNQIESNTAIMPRRANKGMNRGEIHASSQNMLRSHPGLISGQTQLKYNQQTINDSQAYFNGYANQIAGDMKEQGIALSLIDEAMN